MLLTIDGSVMVPRKGAAIAPAEAARALRDLHAAYPALARSAIRIVAGPAKLTFSETSPTGKRFAVVIAKSRLVRQNLEPYAFVF